MGRASFATKRPAQEEGRHAGAQTEGRGDAGPASPPLALTGRVGPLAMSRKKLSLAFLESSGPRRRIAFSRSRVACCQSPVRYRAIPRVLENSAVFGDNCAAFAASPTARAGSRNLTSSAVASNQARLF